MDWVMEGSKGKKLRRIELKNAEPVNIFNIFWVFGVLENFGPKTDTRSCFIIKFVNKNLYWIANLQGS